ncbi:hypothetical protein ACF068_06400 [Streptomyces sp. NPDC016309]|uniref:hypothetical protein n=1 Tax=Streptomyces sp. NPDC016309 TaxID=3364965 RepID=UPI0036FA4090
MPPQHVPRVPHARHPLPHPSHRHGASPSRPGVAFALLNAVTLAVHLLLACSAPELLATRLGDGGEVTLGLVALLLQAALLLWTAARYDHLARRRAQYRRESEHGHEEAYGPGRDQGGRQPEWGAER